VLSGLVKRINDKVRSKSVNTIEDIKSLEWLILKIKKFW
jgi:hypothetical protein